MKKYFSNIFALAALLMAGAAFTACSSDDNSIEQPANPVGEKTYTLTINASKGTNASNRALKLETSGALTAYWKNGDVLTVYNQTKEEALTGTLIAKDAAGATATFSGALTGTIETGDLLVLSYHQPSGMGDYSAQTGTLESAAGRDFATASVAVASVEDGNITIDGESANFDTQTAMLKLTLTTDGTTPRNATQLKITATITVGVVPVNEDLATFTPTAATYEANGNGILYFALPNKATVAAALCDRIKSKYPTMSFLTESAVETALAGATLTYTATVGGNTYTDTRTGYKFVAGKYYAGTLTMVPPSYSLAESTVGMIVGSDGKAYAAAYKDNLPSGVTPVAMVAYKNATAGSSLAIALADEGGTMDWSTARGATGAAAHTPTVEGYSWKLPSQDEWGQMFNAFSGNVNDYTGLNTAIRNAGGTELLEIDYFYWSSGDAPCGVYLFDGVAYWPNYVMDVTPCVRACLAF